jgi:hypothetical protein
VFVGDVRGLFFQSYVGFAEFTGAKILYALARRRPGEIRYFLGISGETGLKITDN